MPVIGASEVDAEGDAKEAGTSTAVTTVGALMLTAGVQAAEETNGSAIKPLPILEERAEGDHTEGVSPMLEERAEGDHAEGVLWQGKQFKRELRVTSLDLVLPVAEEAVARALGEDSDVQEVLRASTMVVAVDLDAMEGVRMTVNKTVLRQG